MQDFLKELADVLEVDEVKDSDVLEAFPEWDSLTALSVIAMIDARYRVNLTAAELKRVDTARSLYELIGNKNGH